MVAAPAPTIRLRLDLAYDGTDFSGWAAQPARRTVEGLLSAALATVLRLPDAVRLVVAGRTDAGVHARGQVAHADVPLAAWAGLGPGLQAPTRALLSRLAGVLPSDIVVRGVMPAPDGFDARFSALSRRYRYRICDDRTLLDPLRRRDTVLVGSPLDVSAMNEAAAALVGLHDFAAFCRRREGATTLRTLQELDWERTDDATVEGTVVADAFCHSMVRSLVGALVPVGERRQPVGFPAEVLHARVRDPRVKVMPAHGLTLEYVTYPPDSRLAERAAESRRTRAHVGDVDGLSEVPG